MKLTKEWLKENCDRYLYDVTDFYCFGKGDHEFYLRPSGGGEYGFYWGVGCPELGSNSQEMYDCQEIITLQDLKILKTMCLGNRDDRDMLVKTLFLDLSVEECLDLYKIKLDIEKQRLSEFAKSLGK